MCGLAALIDPRGNVTAALTAAMTDVIAHRGPDGEGFALFGRDTVLTMRRSDLREQTGSHIGFGHRRLAIVDISEAGHQPMSGAGGRFWIVYNGEIYNHLELRGELEALGHRFSTQSDTEVLLAAWQHWGRDCLTRLNGMFAFVLYDRQTRQVFAVRDRFGVKPLYWWRNPDGLLAIGSEIKQFTVLPGWRAHLNGQRAYEYLNWGLTDHTHSTMFDGVFQVPPGHLLEILLDRMNAAPVAQAWYRLEADAPETNFQDAVAKFRQIFLDSVKLRLRADVPVGTALSGGLDSSSIVCAVNDLLSPSGGRSKTFSARARDDAFDEGRFIEAVLGATRAVPHTVYPDADGLLADLSDLVWHHDEPFGSTSVYAEWCVFRSVAGASVKVTLDGHGADETLIGYTAFIGPQLGQLARRGQIGTLLSEIAAQRQLHRRSPGFLLSQLVDDLLPNALRDPLRRMLGRSHGSPDWLDMSRLQASPSDPFTALGDHGHGIAGMSRAQLAGTSLPMQLKWADRDSMAHSVESREPYLDHRLVSFILGQPDAYKMQGGWTKRLLREALSDIVPPVITRRLDKMGFVTPEELWVRRDRPDAFRQALQQAATSARGLLRPEALAYGNAMIDGTVPFHNRLWRMICFGKWIERFQVEVPT